MGPSASYWQNFVQSFWETRLGGGSSTKIQNIHKEYKNNKAPPSAAPQGGRASRAPPWFCCFCISGKFFVFLWMTPPSSLVFQNYFVQTIWETRLGVGHPQKYTKLTRNTKTTKTKGGARSAPPLGRRRRRRLVVFLFLVSFVYFCG